MTSYAAHPQTWERDPVITPTGLRSEVASGPMSKWARFNDPANLIWMTDPEGRPRGFTRNQVRIYEAAKELAGTGVRVTLREIAERLSLSPSTVWRALVKLTAFGFVSYLSNRGRNGGTVFLLYVADATLDYFRDLAKAKVRKWRLAAEARISRLRGNVASCFPGRERELYEHRYSPSSSNSYRTQHFPEWTPDDFREAGLM